MHVPAGIDAVPTRHALRELEGSSRAMARVQQFVRRAALLRDRADAVPALVARLLDEWCAAHDEGPRAFASAALSLLAALTWPGNVADLTSVVEGAVDVGARTIEIGPRRSVQEIASRPAPPAPSGSLREARLRFEREYIVAVLRHHDGRMADAAQALGIQRPNLYRKVRQLNIPLARAADSPDGTS